MVKLYRNRYGDLYEGTSKMTAKLKYKNPNARRR